MKVLLVEDSATVAAYIVSLLASELDIQMLPVATNAADGVKAALTHRPDVILMDIKLPDHDGLWAIERIMASEPRPIVVLSGYLSSRERDITFESLRAGAVDVLAKPTGLSVAARDAFRRNLVNTVRLMSSAVVVRRRSQAQGARSRPLVPKPSPGRDPELERIHYVLIGASTGGPDLLHQLLSAVPAPFPVPLLIAQHTLEGFDENLAHWLSSTGHPVSVAREGDLPTAGRVLLAPADKHVRVSVAGIELVQADRAAEAASIDSMFESAARCWGSQCLALLLSGMGRDGSAGMRALFDRGSLTVAQAAHTCVVPSMPESARAKGAVKRVLAPDEMAALLLKLATSRRGDAQSSMDWKGT